MYPSQWRSSVNRSISVRIRRRNFLTPSWGDAWRSSGLSSKNRICDTTSERPVGPRSETIGDSVLAMAVSNSHCGSCLNSFFFCQAREQSGAESFFDSGSVQITPDGGSSGVVRGPLPSVGRCVVLVLGLLGSRSSCKCLRTGVRRRFDEPGIVVQRSYDRPLTRWIIDGTGNACTLQGVWRNVGRLRRCTREAGRKAPPRLRLRGRRHSTLTGWQW